MPKLSLVERGILHAFQLALLSCVRDDYAMGSVFHLLIANSRQEDQSSLQFTDIAIDSVTSPSMLETRLRCSKTDWFDSGVSIFLGKTYALYLLCYASLSRGQRWWGQSSLLQLGQQPPNKESDREYGLPSSPDTGP
jgi:hypothetical protein